MRLFKNFLGVVEKQHAVLATRPEAVEDALSMSARRALSSIKPAHLQAGAAVFLTATKIERLHTGVGATGRLAQPLLEPEE